MSIILVRQTCSIESLNVDVKKAYMDVLATWSCLTEVYFAQLKLTFKFGKYISSTQVLAQIGIENDNENDA